MTLIVVEDIAIGWMHDARAALRLPTTEEWESAKMMIHELYIERRSSVVEVGRELAKQGYLVK